MLHKIQHQLANPADWRRQYVTVKNCAAFVVEIRKFFDAYRDAMSWAQNNSYTAGAQSSYLDGLANREQLLDRFNSHTKHCAVS